MAKKKSTPSGSRRSRYTKPKLTRHGRLEKIAYGMAGTKE